MPCRVARTVKSTPARPRRAGLNQQPPRARLQRVIKSELVSRLADLNPHLYERNCEAIVNAVLGRIVEALADGKRVELRGFGASTTKTRRPRQGRNPDLPADRLARWLAC